MARTERIGLKAQDTSKLFFDDVRVPANNLLGEEIRGFARMMTKRASERLTQAIRLIIVTDQATNSTVDYTKERKAFGQTVGNFWNNLCKMAELAT